MTVIADDACETLTLIRLEKLSAVRVITSWQFLMALQKASWSWSERSSVMSAQTHCRSYTVTMRHHWSNAEVNVTSGLCSDAEGCRALYEPVLLIIKSLFPGSKLRGEEEGGANGNWTEAPQGINTRLLVSIQSTWFYFRALSSQIRSNRDLIKVTVAEPGCLIWQRASWIKLIKLALPEAEHCFIRSITLV